MWSLLLLLVISEAPPGQAALEEGKRHLAALDDERAVEAFEKGLAQTSTPTLQAQLWLYLGLARFERLDSLGARQAFLEAVSLDPSVRLPASANPRATALFAETAVAAKLKPAKEPLTAEAPSRRWGPHLRWPALGLGAVALIAGGAAFAVSRGISAERERALNALDAETASSAMRSARSRAGWATGLGVGAGLAAAGALGWTLWPSPQGGATVAFGGSF